LLCTQLTSSAKWACSITGSSWLGGGAILSGPVLGAIAVFIIEKKFAEAGYFAAADAALSFFGFMHGESVGLAVTPSIAAAYAVVAAFRYALSRMPAESAASASIERAPAATPAE
jgi:adenine/guanine/hypoxanthine permease